MGLKQVSFIERLSLARRVPYWRFQCTFTLETLNNGHIETMHLVLYRAVVLSLEVKNNRKVNVWDFKVCPLVRGFFYSALIWSVLYQRFYKYSACSWI